MDIYYSYSTYFQEEKHKGNILPERIRHKLKSWNKRVTKTPKKKANEKPQINLPLDEEPTPAKTTSTLPSILQSHCVPLAMTYLCKETGEMIPNYVLLSGCL